MAFVTSKDKIFQVQVKGNLKLKMTRLFQSILSMPGFGGIVAVIPTVGQLFPRGKGE